MIDKIKEKLNKHPEIKYKIKDNSINIPPANSIGFGVTLIDGRKSDGEITIYSDYLWHDHFDQEHDALSCLAMCLSAETRLKVTYRGDHPLSARMEIQKGDNWDLLSETGTYSFLLWKKKTVKIYQNKWFHPNS